ncbi:MAG: vWA domain-containing protein, partial [Singulisphaera sp.]
LAASLAHLMIGQRDAVGLVTADGGARGVVPPRSSPGHLSVLCKALEETEAGGEAPLSGLLHALAERAGRRGLVVVLSDGFEPLDALTAALRHLRHRRHEVLFLHVLAPEEEEFPFGRPTRFRDLEARDRSLRVDPATFRAAYLGRFRAFCRALRQNLGAMEADYHKASTAEAPERTLLDYLASRSRGKARRGGGA